MTVRSIRDEVNDQVVKTWDAAKKNVALSCDENHVHSARQGCLSGDARDVTICALVETLQEERRVVREAAAKLETALFTKIGNT